MFSGIKTVSRILFPLHPTKNIMTSIRIATMFRTACFRLMLFVLIIFQSIILPILSLYNITGGKGLYFHSRVSEGTRVSVAVCDGVKVYVSVGVFEGEGVNVSVGFGDGVCVLVIVGEDDGVGVSVLGST